MNQKEINELRRRWRPDKNNVSHIYGCYVDVDRKIVADLEEPTSLMNQDEVEKYLGLLKKGPVGRHGQEPDRHRFRHSAGGGQR